MTGYLVCLNACGVFIGWQQWLLDVLVLTMRLPGILRRLQVMNFTGTGRWILDRGRLAVSGL